MVILENAFQVSTGFLHGLLTSTVAILLLYLILVPLFNTIGRWWEEYDSDRLDVKPVDPVKKAMSCYRIIEEVSYSGETIYKVQKLTLWIWRQYNCYQGRKAIGDKKFILKILNEVRNDIMRKLVEDSREIDSVEFLEESYGWIDDVIGKRLNSGVGTYRIYLRYNCDKAIYFESRDPKREFTQSLESAKKFIDEAVIDEPPSKPEKPQIQIVKQW